MYVRAAAQGTFPTGNYIGTLDNDGTGLAPFHNFDVQGPGEPEGGAGQDQGGHRLRHDQDHLAQPAEVTLAPHGVEH